MKKLGKIIISMLCAAALTVPILATACEKKDPEGSKPEPIDYADELELDFTTNTKKQEVTIRQYVDGDTTHFDPVANSKLQGCNNAADFSSDKAPVKTKGFAKARYLAVNTPESTGQIEPWGGTASEFTHNKLKNATSYIIESDDENWNIDSTGERYLLWVWYMPEGGTKYRNLNLEILQAGLAYNSSAANNRYGEYCMKALNQAEDLELYVFSGEKDPDYPYGEAKPIDLKELRFNTEAYVNKRVRVQGLVTANFKSTAYIEETYYDIEGFEGTGIRIGFPVYYSYTKGKVVENLATGNYVSVVGVVKEHAGSYQITDIKEYNRYNKNDPNNCNVLEEKVGLDDAYTPLDIAAFNSTQKNVTVGIEKTNDEGEEIIDYVSMTYHEALLGTSVSVQNVTVYRVSTTTSTTATSIGAMTLYCRTEGGLDFQVRTEVLEKEDGTLWAEADYKNMKINVKGLVEKYTPDAENDPDRYYFQIKCHRADYIEVLGPAS